MKSRNEQRLIRHKRLRAKISGTQDRPRLAIFRSNQGLYVQVIDDVKRVTLFGLKGNGKSIASAQELGKLFVAELKKQKISTVVFDRGGYMYHGRVKAFADSVRDGGIIF